MRLLSKQRSPLELEDLTEMESIASLVRSHIPPEFVQEKAVFLFTPEEFRVMLLLSSILVALYMFELVSWLFG